MEVRALDRDAPEWYKPFAVKITATTASEQRFALDASLGRGNFTAYYWRFS